MKYYKHSDEHRAGIAFEIRERGPGAGDAVLATTTDSVFADRIVDLLNEDEAIEQLIGKHDTNAVARLIDTALKS